MTHEHKKSLPQTLKILNEYDRRHACDFLTNVPLNKPLEVTIEEKGTHRSLRQNRLQHLWLSQIAKQLEGHTQEEWRGYCKLTIGVPILRAENESFRAQYDEIVRPLPYEQKIKIMQNPIDLPVTSLMTVEQKTKYLDAMQQHFLEQGVLLTDPEERGARSPEPAARFVREIVERFNALTDKNTLEDASAIYEEACDHALTPNQQTAIQDAYNVAVRNVRKNNLAAGEMP